jgi:hypothetical protein
MKRVDERSSCAKKQTIGNTQAEPGNDNDGEGIGRPTDVSATTTPWTEEMERHTASSPPQQSWSSTIHRFAMAHGRKATEENSRIGHGFTNTMMRQNFA